MAEYADVRASVALGAAAMCLSVLSANADEFATRVVSFSPAPGQFVNHPAFSDPALALGPPRGGGTYGADNTKVVSLGGFGGTITLGFDRMVMDDPGNPLGLDAIVFGNAVWVGGNANRRFAEPGVIEISRDMNGNGIADDPWYVIPGTHLTEPSARLTTRTWDSDTADPVYPPANPAWIPPEREGVWTTTGYLLPPPIGDDVVLVNPNGLNALVEGVYGYADCSPTLILGDTDADNSVDDPAIAAEEFYTIPHDPARVGIEPGFGTRGGKGGGGDAFDIAWAVDPVTNLPAHLDRFDFIRITTAVDRVDMTFGEVSTEISGVAIIRAIAVRRPADWNHDGAVNSQDFFDFLASFFAGDADFNHSGATDSQDFFDFLTAFFAG